MELTRFSGVGGVGGGRSHEGSCLVHLQQLLLIQIGTDLVHQRSRDVSMHLRDQKQQQREGRGGD